MNKVLKGAGVLAVCAVIAKLIGALYRIPLTNIVGAQGIGLYQMIFPLYTVLLTVSSGGLPVAISRVVASKIAVGDELGAKRVLRVSVVSLAIIGLVLGGLLAVFRNQIALLQGNPLAAVAYLGIAPSIFFVGIISAFRGYYQGKQNMLPSALSQLSEQLVKVGIGLVLARMLMPFGVQYAILGALLGVSVSELVTAIILAFMFLGTTLRFKKKTKIPVNKVNALSFEAGADLRTLQKSIPHTLDNKKRSVLKEIYKVAIPVTLGSLVMPITQVIDSILVINILNANGIPSETATSLYGLLTGPTNTLLNMPVVVTLAFAVALLPKVTECFSKKENPNDAIAQALKFNFILGLLSFAAFIIFGGTIIQTLYNRGLNPAEISLATTLLIVGSLSIPYVSLLQVATAVLQGVNKAHKPAINLLFGAVIKIILTIILLPIVGVLGAAIASVVCFGITCILNIISVKKVVTIKLKPKEFLLAPIIATAGFAGVSVLLLWVLSGRIGNLWSSIIALTAALIVFILLLFVFKGITRADLKDFPFIGKMFKRKKKAG